MTDDEIAECLVRGYIAFLAQTMLNNDPTAVRDSVIWGAIEPHRRANIIPLIEQKVRAKLQTDLATAFEDFRKFKPKD